MGLLPPAFSTELYRDVVGVATASPAWVQDFMRHFTELSIILLMLLWLAAWWRARSAPATTMALALVGPAAGVTAYLTSEVAKTFLTEERPCRAVGLPIVAAECPPVGDWSFPSNHSTIAGALFIAVFLVSWRLGIAAMIVGTSAAFSRVFVGVHYPHDVLTGFFLGATLTALVTLLVLRPATRAVTFLRAVPALRPILATPAAMVPATVRAERPLAGTGTRHHR
ncbi:phosphatase PAP2 family protein [Actinoplanes sp. NBRC 101535]|uniref:phosphatase PAP2 family protein n=1 Tax=Actinoplanes sp. NBRC 101535 TaxID=3032196 RepID=UPI0024A1BDA4|nr:phosphatase PAP2 family protein [Actinoplanes sp. NBRC 101535]GLY06875.1 phosphatase PAP2 family protein [Actinoplanes sp. NBRC 101535]